MGAGSKRLPLRGHKRERETERDGGCDGWDFLKHMSHLVVDDDVVAGTESLTAGWGAPRS